MFASDQMRYGAIVMAAIFGGPGVFYCIESFAHPTFALHGLLYLGIAIALLATAQRQDAAPAPPKAPRRKRRR